MFSVAARKKHAYIKTCVCLLSVGFFEEGAPELISGFRVAEGEFAILGGQHVVDDHVHPATETPEGKLEDTSVGVLLGPLLLLQVGDHLDPKDREIQSVCYPRSGEWKIEPRVWLVSQIRETVPLVDIKNV